ncbi:MAG: zinc-ribbon domain-containing protein [Clostridia bacterium]|nr:zinc-ribbon domain-containing protein [Clostridia bacterium]
MLKGCMECGKVVSTDAKFCPHCGYQPKGSCKDCIENVSFSDDLPDNDPVTGEAWHCCSIHGCCPAFINGHDAKQRQKAFDLMLAHADDDDEDYKY